MVAAPPWVSLGADSWGHPKSPRPCGGVASIADGHSRAIGPTVRMGLHGGRTEAAAGWFARARAKVESKPRVPPRRSSRHLSSGCGRTFTALGAWTTQPDMAMHLAPLRAREVQGDRPPPCLRPWNSQKVTRSDAMPKMRRRRSDERTAVGAHKKPQNSARARSTLAGRFGAHIASPDTPIAEDPELMNTPTVDLEKLWNEPPHMPVETGATVSAPKTDIQG